jgi:hypothetical protein
VNITWAVVDSAWGFFFPFLSFPILLRFKHKRFEEDSRQGQMNSTNFVNFVYHIYNNIKSFSLQNKI